MSTTDIRAVEKLPKLIYQALSHFLRKEGIGLLKDFGKKFYSNWIKSCIIAAEIHREDGPWLGIMREP